MAYVRVELFKKSLGFCARPLEFWSWTLQGHVRPCIVSLELIVGPVFTVPLVPAAVWEFLKTTSV